MACAERNLTLTTSRGLYKLGQLQLKSINAMAENRFHKYAPYLSNSRMELMLLQGTRVRDAAVACWADPGSYNARARTSHLCDDVFRIQQLCGVYCFLVRPRVSERAF